MADVTLRALEVAARLEQMGVVIRSAELREEADRRRHFAANGNRAMRRSARRARRRKGHA